MLVEVRVASRRSLGGQHLLGLSPAFWALLVASFVLFSPQHATASSSQTASCPVGIYPSGSVWTFIETFRERGLATLRRQPAQRHMGVRLEVEEPARLNAGAYS